MNQMALCIFAFQRPHYLKRCMDSIQAQVVPFAPGDVHVFNDGAVNKFSGRKIGEPQLVEASLRLLADHPVGPRIIRNERNLGTALQQYNAYELLSREGYRWAVVLEEDTVVSPHFHRVCQLLRPILERDPDAFSATPSFMRYNCAPKDIEIRLDQVEEGAHPWIGYLADLSKWERLKTVFDQYMAMVKNLDYGQRPHQRIREWYKQVGWPGQASSQDGGKEASLHRLGMRRYRCRVNRGFYIGEVGFHGRKPLYDQQGWAQYVPFVHERDATLTELRVV